MKKLIIFFIKGLIIGLGKIIPGVSGALLAISLNVYDKGINAITNFFNNKKENLFFLISTGLGIAISIFLFSNILSFLFTNYYFFSMMLFIGLIIGGLYPFIKKNFDKRKLLTAILSLGIIFFLSSLNPNSTNISGNNFLYFLSGIVDAFATVTPGVSGTLLLLLIGTYQNILNAISQIQIPILIFYGAGMFLGIIIFSKLINYLYQKHAPFLNHIIIGLSSATIVILIIQTLTKFTSLSELIIGLIFLTLGMSITKLLPE